MIISGVYVFSWSVDWVCNDCMCHIYDLQEILRDFIALRFGGDVYIYYMKEGFAYMAGILR
jgi:hypothetical protein